jgi:ABC-type dipeptide/oligopeptide/nickel transport system permease subunit
MTDLAMTGSTAKRPSVPAQLLRELLRDKPATLSTLFLLLLVFAAIFAPLVAPHDPATQALRERLDPPLWLEGGSWSHILGTDNLGRDVLSRIIYGARTSLTVGLCVVAIAGSFGVTIGLVAAYVGGRVDNFVMSWVDTQLSFPDLLLALTVLTVLGSSPVTVVVILSISGWMVYARMTRGIVKSTRNEGYVEAAELVGCSIPRIIFIHILPNLAAPLSTLLILEFARVILAEAALSFLGMGIQPPATSWGLDIAVGKDHIFGAWWLVTFPGAAIALTILSANLLAAWVRTTADPQEREKRFARSAAGRLMRTGKVKA